MKRYTWILAGISILAVSCAQEEESKEEKDLTYDEKVEAVCDCFDDKAESGQPPKDCFMLQGKYETTVGENKRVEFIQSTNECAN